MRRTLCEAAITRAFRFGCLTAAVALALCSGCLPGCRPSSGTRPFITRLPPSLKIDEGILVRNDSAQNIARLVVTYPGGKFGASNLKPGGGVSQPMSLPEVAECKLDITYADGRTFHRSLTLSEYQHVVIVFLVEDNADVHVESGAGGNTPNDDSGAHMRDRR